MKMQIMIAMTCLVALYRILLSFIFNPTIIELHVFRHYKVRLLGLRTISSGPETTKGLCDPVPNQLSRGSFSPIDFDSGFRHCTFHIFSRSQSIRPRQFSGHSYPIHPTSIQWYCSELQRLFSSHPQEPSRPHRMRHNILHSL
jgi:hypothetical protein